MLLRITAIRVLTLSLTAYIGTPAFAQGLIPPPGGTIIAPPSTALERQLGNFVAAPILDPTTQIAQAESRFGLPAVFPNPTVPTDVTGIGGSLGHAQGLEERLLGPDRRVVPDSRGLIVARDPRYCFTGIWQPPIQGQTALASLPGVLIFPAVVPRTIDLATNSVQVMPTIGASYSVSAGNALTLSRGALLVKGGAAPTTICMPLPCGTALVRIEQGAFSMVSNLDGRVAVANMDDRHTGAVAVSLSSPRLQNAGELPIRVGNMVEIYPTAARIGENRLVAYSVLNQAALANGYSVETMTLNYPRALKRFNITRNLSEPQLNRLLKTAAAVATVDGQRQTYGLLQ